MIGKIATLACLMMSAPVYAGFVKSSYTQYVMVMTERMSQISRDMGLSANERESAEQAASIFYLYGPCKGGVTPEPRSGDLPGLSSALSHEMFDNKTNTAISAYVGLFVRQYDLGRTPGEFNCRLAADTAYPLLPAKYSIRACFIPYSAPNGSDEVCQTIR